MNQAKKHQGGGCRDFPVQDFHGTHNPRPTTERGKRRNADRSDEYRAKLDREVYGN